MNSFFVDFSASNACTWFGLERTTFRFTFDSLGVVFGLFLDVQCTIWVIKKNAAISLINLKQIYRKKIKIGN